MADNKDMVITIRLNDLVTKGFRKVTRFVRASARYMVRGISGVVRRLLDWRALLAGGGIGGLAIKMANDFEASMQQIVGLVGVAQEQVNEWASDVKKMAQEVGKAPAELADAMFFITSAGLRGADALSALRASAKAAVAGLGETKVIADAVTSAMNAYGAANLSAEQATAVLVATVREGKAEASSIGSALGRVIPLASEMGVRFSEIGASLAAMTRTGLDANEAVTALRGILATLQKPTQESKKALEAVGLSTTQLRNILTQDGVLGVLRTLKERFQGNTAALTSIIPNIRAATGALSLVGKNAEQNEKIFASLAKTTGEDLTNAYEVAARTGRARFARAMATAKVALIDLGDALRPLVAEVLEFVTSVMRSGLITWFRSMGMQLKAVFSGMGGSFRTTEEAARTWAERIMWGTEKVAQGFAVLWDVVRMGRAAWTAIQLGWITFQTGLTTGVGVVRLMFAKFWQNLKNSAIRVWNKIAEFFPRFTKTAVASFALILRKFGEFTTAYAVGLRNMPDWFVPDSAIEGVERISAAMSDAAIKLRRFSHTSMKLKEDTRDLKIGDFIDTEELRKSMAEMERLKLILSQYVNSPTARDEVEKFFQNVRDQMRLLESAAAQSGRNVGKKYVEGARKVLTSDEHLEAIRHWNAQVVAENAAAAQQSQEHWNKYRNTLEANWEEMLVNLHGMTEGQAEMTAYMLKAVQDSLVQFVTDTLDAAFEGQIQSMKDVGKIALDILKDLMKQVIAYLVRLAIQAAITKAIASAQGNVLIGGFEPVSAFAKGGLVTQPTIGLVGEGGQNEAVVPLPDGRRIPVKMEGGEGGQTPANVNVSIQATDAKSFTQLLSTPEGRRTITGLFVEAMRTDPRLAKQVRSGGI